MGLCGTQQENKENTPRLFISPVAPEELAKKPTNFDALNKYAGKTKEEIFGKP